MFYVGNAPWHGLGTRLESLATSKEAIDAAKLGWGVRLEPLFAQHGEMQLKVPNRFATVRDDRHEVLGVVGKSYTPVQNADAFSFFDGVVGEGKAIYEVAGSLGRGEQVWILAKLPGELRIAKDDIVEKNLLLVNSHDGMSTLKMFFTPIRVVCQNTLSASLSQRKAGEGLALKHYAGIAEKISAAQDILGIATRKYDELGEMYKHLASVKVDTPWIEEYVKLCFPAVKEDQVSTHMKNVRQSVVELVDSASNTLVGSAGTAWGAYNAVTEYIDHRKTAKTGAKLRSIWIGTGAVVKDAALRLAVNLTK
jgi:phage/plasmid-like protein (TIGR03299 family)